MNLLINISRRRIFIAVMFVIIQIFFVKIVRRCDGEPHLIKKKIGNYIQY